MSTLGEVTARRFRVVRGSVDHGSELDETFPFSEEGFRAAVSAGRDFCRGDHVGFSVRDEAVIEWNSREPKRTVVLYEVGFFSNGKARSRRNMPTILSRWEVAWS